MMRLFGSARMAAWLIGALLLLLVVAFVVPQRSVIPAEQVDGFLDSLPGAVAAVLVGVGIDRVFASWLFYAVAIALALNLSVCTIQRLGTLRARRGGAAPAGRSAPAHATRLLLTDLGPLEVMLAKMAAHPHVTDDGYRHYRVLRGAVGFAGSLASHLALIILLVGGVASGLTTFTGEMVFTEGQSRIDDPGEYLTIGAVPRLGPGFGEFLLTLDRMEFVYEGDTVVDAVAHFTVAEEREQRADRARVNEPLRVQGKSFLLYDAGHSVWLTIEDQAGRTLLDSFVNLAEATSHGYRDAVEVELVVLQLVSRPDRSVPLERPVEQGLQLVSPVVGIAPVGSAPEDYTWLSPGESATIAGLLVTCREVRLWNRFLVRADEGRHFVYLGFAIIVFGSALRFIDPDRWLRVAMEPVDGGWMVQLWGAERYRVEGLPREGQKIVNALGSGVDERPEGSTPGKNR